jgi:hypothetical protein
VRATVLSSLAVVAAGCVHTEIPYDFSRVEAGQKPVHAKRIAVLPFSDARSLDDGPDDAEGLVYQGVELDHTDLGSLRGSPLDRVTEIVGRHLAVAHVFSQVILVERVQQAPEADLILTGSVRRMRGYVEAQKPAKASGRPENERIVLAEVVLADVLVRDAKDPKKVMFAGDIGWSVQEKRLEGDNAIDPWDVLGEALHKALSDFTSELAKADLSGTYVVKPKVELALGPGSAGVTFGDLEAAPPEGWRFARTATASEPTGWNASDARCEEVHLEQRQTLRFHRVLGPYRPSVTIWACPSDLHLSYDAMEEFPASYLGKRADGFHYFARSVGETNWPNALDQIGRHLQLVPPRQRYVFEIGRDGG